MKKIWSEQKKERKKERKNEWMKIEDNWGDEIGCDEGHWYAHTRGLPWELREVVWTVNKCIAAGGDDLEGDLSFMCVLSIKVAIQKTLETYLMILVYIYIYILH